MNLILNTFICEEIDEFQLDCICGFRTLFINWNLQSNNNEVTDIINETCLILKKSNCVTCRQFGIAGYTDIPAVNIFALYLV